MTTTNRHEPDPGSFRTKCQRWGVVYVFDANEPPPPPGGGTGGATGGAGTGGTP